MTKAEERALEAYPVKIVNGPIGYEKSVFDFNAFCRYIFQEGYEQAEKDINKEMMDRMAKIREKQNEAALSDVDYKVYFDPAFGFDTGSAVVYHNDKVIDELTWKDIKDIVRTADGLMYMAESLSDTEKRLGVQTYYEEVLRRFKAIKEEK